MLHDLPVDFRWPSPWSPLTDSQASIDFVRSLADPFDEEPLASTIEAELQRELCPGHPLYRVETWVVASNREDFNEYLFVTDDAKMPVVFVHLTWTQERTPDFPFTVIYSSWEEFRAAWEEEDA